MNKLTYRNFRAADARHICPATRCDARVTMRLTDQQRTITIIHRANLPAHFSIAKQTGILL